MKTIITLLTATVLVAGATGAMAVDRQANDEAPGYALSQRTTQGFDGAYASAPARGHVRNPTVETPRTLDFSRVPAAR
jgi:hypothetical protein